MFRSLRIFGGGEDPVVAVPSQIPNSASNKEVPPGSPSVLPKTPPTVSNSKENKSPVTTPISINNSSKDGPSNKKRTIIKEVPRSNSDTASMNMFRASQRNSLSSIEDLRLSDGDSNSKLRKEASFRRDSKDFWMPDHEVMFCYDCQAPFSTFKVTEIILKSYLNFNIEKTPLQVITISNLEIINIFNYFIEFVAKYFVGSAHRILSNFSIILSEFVMLALEHNPKFFKIPLQVLPKVLLIGDLPQQMT